MNNGQTFTFTIPAHLTDQLNGLTAHPPVTEAEYNSSTAYGWWGPIVGRTDEGDLVLLVDWVDEDEDGTAIYAGYQVVRRTA